LGGSDPRSGGAWRLNLIGSGRVGKTLGRLWHASGVLTVQDVLTTSPATAQAAVDFIGAGTACTTLQAMRPADLWMIATPDAQLARVAQQLVDHRDDHLAVHLAAHLVDRLPAPWTAHGASHRAESGHHPAGAVPPMVFHCSGALGAAVLQPLQALGWQVASAHCLLSFATPAAAVAQFAGTPCALEGEPALCAQLQTLFTAIGARCFDLASDQKLLYHAGGVFATNFLPVLQSVAEDLWRSSGMPEALVADLRASLLHNAVANITRLGPQGALTGPAARGDLQAIERQGVAVAQWSPPAGQAYAALSELALQLALKK